MGNSIGVLYVVATPIGNLADITFRAVEILNFVDLILAEDTRTTGVLLQKYNIKTQTSSYHKFSEKQMLETVIQKLLEGENIALVSDAGTPLISDPGNILVFEAEKNGIRVVPVGGISAVTTFLSSISREDEDFKFVGFLPRVKGQIEAIIKKNRGENLIFYESPKRIKETFRIILEVAPDTLISYGRELTKKFEEIKTGYIKDILYDLEQNQIRGEFICMVHKLKENCLNEANLFEKVKLLKQKGFSLKDTACVLEITDGASKNRVKEMFFKG